MAYAALSMVAMCGIISLGVDFGRVQIARSQLQAAADAAARYGVTGVQHEIGNVNAAEAMARVMLRENTVDGKAIVDAQATIEYGEWKTDSLKFKDHNQTTKRNAVRVTVRCANSSGTAIPLMFGSLIGRPQQELSASAVAMIEQDANLTNASNYQQAYVPATSNPWLAGSPNGTKANVGNPHNNPDTAGATLQSPINFNSLSLRAGSTVTFDGVNGGANNLQSNTLYTGDGNLSWIVSNFGGSENGKSNVTAPINSVIAVFLNDNVPSGPTPANLDFSTSSSRDFATLAPQLNQPFFVGDGRRANGDMQQFVVPAGATRLFVGTMDGYEWNNNVGGFTVTVTTAPTVTLVQ